MTDSTISIKISQIRKKKKMSQKELADKLGISNRAVSKWETGLSAPTMENLSKISKIFGVPFSYFFESDEAHGEQYIQPNGMKSLKELYKIGRGPSSTHTMGPEKACILFYDKNPGADKYKVILYGSLAKLSSDHITENVIKETLSPIECEIEFNFTQADIPHPNTMDMIAYKNGSELDKIRVISHGGGEISIEGSDIGKSPEIYPHASFEEIAQYCKSNGLRLWEYVEKFEDETIVKYMSEIWKMMCENIKHGTQAEGVLPGGLNVYRKARHLIKQQHIDESSETRENRMVCSYAFAVGEENACGESVVTAPSCGAAGVMPAVLFYQQQKKGFSDLQIIHALETGGIIGNLVKTNASISGAECGCQAEIGTACAMAAAALGELFEMDIDRIEYSAEIAIEHHLGLTCDPIAGLVQIPCIERNAVAAMRAINAVNLAGFLSDTRKISLDKVIDAMRETGRDIAKQYKETSEGGLAKIKL